jgi:hypothetical protein
LLEQKEKEKEKKELLADRDNYLSKSFSTARFKTYMWSEKEG